VFVVDYRVENASSSSSHLPVWYWIAYNLLSVPLGVLWVVEKTKWVLDSKIWR
jgi:hypothetical protein